MTSAPYGDDTNPQQTPLPRRQLGSTDLFVTPLCIGTSPLASEPSLYGYEVEEEQAVQTVLAALSSPIQFLDTSNGYGVDGAGERRIGEALRRIGGVPESVVLATKVDPDPVNGDFSGPRVLRSVEESLERLGLDRLQLLYFHDPERITFEEAITSGGAVEALVALQDEGVVRHLGVAGGPVELLRRYVETEVFAVVLSHNRFTLMDRTAERLMDDALARGMGYVNAAPYGGGILAKGPGRQPRYGYLVDNTSARNTVIQIEEACARYGVPLAAAALQFSCRDDRVASTVIGISTPARIEETMTLFNWQIPTELWDELTEMLDVSAQAGMGLP
jgi:D-threo-aldose 1-dehydrogenase